jgi:hypothetical protein
MDPVEIKSVGQLIDELIVANIRIWHLVDEANAGNGKAAVKAQQVNKQRSALIRAIDGRLEPEAISVPEKDLK